MNTFIKSLSFLLLALLFQNTQAQIEPYGNALYGRLDGNGLFGYSTTINSNGTVVAASAPLHSGDGLELSGYTEVYKYTEGVWEQMGQTIYGDTDEVFCGHRIALSDDGLLLAISFPGGSDSDIAHIRFYEFDGSEWVTARSPLTGYSSDGFGLHMEMTPDGSHIAVCSLRDDTGAPQAGKATVYEYTAGVWSQKGTSFYGDQFNESLGLGMAIANDGNRIAIFQGKSIDFPDANAQIDVYEFDGTDWQPLGQPFFGDEYSNNFGLDLSFDQTGSILIIGDSANNEGGEFAGKIWSFTLDDTDNWVPYAAPIFGNENQHLGYRLELDNSGTRLLASSPSAYGLSGEAAVFDYNDGDWVQLGDVIAGSQINNQAGYASTLSADGGVIAVGTIYDSNDDGIITGSTKLYSLPPLLSVPENSNSNIVVYPNPTQDKLFLNGNSISSFEFEIYTVTGIKISRGTYTDLGIDISALASGVYLLKVKSAEQRQTLKFVKN